MFTKNVFSRTGITALTIIVLGAFFYSTSFVFAATTATLLPDGNGSQTAWDGAEDDLDDSVGSEDCVDNSSDGDDNVSTSVTGERESVNLNETSIPNGSTITSIEIFVWEQGATSTGGTYKTFMRDDDTSTNSDATTDLVVTSSSICTAKSQVIDVVDFVKDSGTDLEIGVLKTGTNTSKVWIGAIRAIVTYTPLTLTTSAGANGSISPNGTTAFATNDDLDVDITPNATYIVADTIVDGLSQGRSNEEDFDNATTSHTVSTTFEGGWSAPTADFNDSGVSSEANAYTSNSADAVFNGTDSVEYGNFGLSGSGIVGGIEVALEGERDGTRVLDIQLSWNGGSSWTAAQSASFSDSETTIILGGTNNTWGRTWTTTELTNANFRVRAASGTGSNDINLDQIQVKVTSAPAGTLTVRKVVVNDNGGTADADDFSFSVNSGSAQVFEADGENNLTVEAGTYSVVETASSQYATTYDNCNSVSVTDGGTTICTITNNDIEPTLTLVKNVVTTGDTAEVPPTSADWTLSASGPSSLSGAGGVSGSVNAGTYALSESTGPTHYSGISGWSCTGAADTEEGDGITLLPGENVTCTITNTYVVPGTIVIVKEAVGGDATFSFTGDLGAFDLSTGNSYSQSFTSLEPGTFTVTEGAQPEGWVAGAASCVRNGTGDSFSPESFSLGSEDSVVCTFTNIKMGQIIIQKVTDPTGDAQSFDFNPSWSESDFSLSDGGSHNSGNLEPGTYAVSEGTLSAGWALDSATCSDGSEVSSIDLDAGEVVTCTFVNNKLAVLTIIKQVDGESTGSFAFSVEKSETEGEGLQTVTLQNGSEPDMSHSFYLEAGSWDVSENLAYGWQLANVSCDYDGNEAGVTLEYGGGKEVTIDNGDDVTCTFLNTRRAIIRVEKVVINDNGGTADAEDFSFQVSENESPVGGPVSFDEDGNGYLIVDGNEGDTTHTYAVTETAVSGYTTTYEGCSEISISNGHSATCVITNNDNEDITPEPEPETPNSSSGNGPIVGSIAPTSGQVLGASIGPVGTTTTTGQVLGAETSCASEALLTEYMRIGRANNPAEVRKLQEFLNKEMGTTIPVTGFFGPLTDAGVKAFQTKYAADVLAPWGITAPTGYVYKMTMWKINSLLCASLNAPKPQV